MMNLGMGTMHLELYISPSVMSDQELAFLSEKLKWWLDNANVLAHTKMILGNPHRGEVYAYAHFAPDGQTARKGLIFARNPSTEKKKAAIVFDDSIDLPKSVQDVRLSAIYPDEPLSVGQATQGETISFDLEPLETRVLEVQWDGAEGR
jgi:hypothetical protein